ncbi:MAG: response regulator [Leptolyngbyaceae cyanobacterium MO_188.B28]|nr:response regulator [Leptolyngbyaceae cyanobacterium MO_188.B28]
MILKNSTSLTAKILIVEDEEVFAWHLQEILEEFGHQVLSTVASGEEAIQVAAAKEPDLVLMDICLEGDVDGVTAAAEIYLGLNIPVVYLTAYTDEETLQRALATFPFGYLTKPIQEKELHTTINVALNRHRLEQRLGKTPQSGHLGSLDGEGCVTLADHVVPIHSMETRSEERWSLTALTQAHLGVNSPNGLQFPPPQFPPPQFHFGQKVRTQGGFIGYISGMVFYPDTENWNYGVYLLSVGNGKVCEDAYAGMEEVWYVSEELSLALDV